MEPNQLYEWEIQLADGTIRRQYDEAGREQTWKDLDPGQVVRVSFVPRIPLLPAHDVLIDLAAGERFVRRFGRGFMRQGEDGIRLREYIQCCVTNRYRLYVFSMGKAMVTRPDFEVYV